MSYKILESKAQTMAELMHKRKAWLKDFSDGALGNQEAYARARDSRAQFEFGAKWVLLEDALRELDGMEIHGWRDCDEIRNCISDLAREFKDMNCTNEKWDSSWAETFYKNLECLANDETRNKNV